MKKFTILAITLIFILSNYAISQECQVGVITDTTGMTASNVHGGSTGAFVREMTCPGYQGITSYITPPSYNTSSSNEQPWIYYGFSDGSVDVEAGLAFQKGNSTIPPRWRPYIRKGNQFLYAEETYSITPNTKVRMKAVYKGGEISLYIGDKVVLSLRVYMNSSSIRIRRVTGIATPYPFDGTNIYSDGLNNVVWESTEVTSNSGVTYVSLDNEPLSAWQVGSVWYGSIYWPSNKIIYENSRGSDIISIFPSGGTTPCGIVDRNMRNSISILIVCLFPLLAILNNLWKR